MIYQMVEEARSVVDCPKNFKINQSAGLVLPLWSAELLSKFSIQSQKICYKKPKLKVEKYKKHKA